MSVSVSVNNTSYTIPQTQETGWGDQVTAWIQAVSSSTLQKNGGTFTLTADVNFGASFGVLSNYFTSRTANPAATGVVRLANNEGVNWRNAANGADKILKVDASDQLSYASVAFLSSAGVVIPAAGGTGITSYAVGDLLYASTTTALSKRTIGSTSQVLKVSGGLPTWGIVDALGGGTGLSSFTIGDTLYADSTTTIAKLGIGSSGTFLKSNGAGVAPSWASAGGVSAISIKTSNYTVLNTDDTLIGDCSSGPANITFTLPAAGSNTGKIYTFVRYDTSIAQIMNISRSGSDKIIYNKTQNNTFTMYTVDERLRIQSDGTNWYVLTHDTSCILTLTPVPNSGAFGTISGASYTARRVGEYLDLTGTFVCGTVAAGNAKVALPTGYVVDTTRLVTTKRAIVGQVQSADDATSGSFGNRNGICMIDNSDTSNFYLSTGFDNGNFRIDVGNVIYNSTDTIMFRAMIPISGWVA